MEDAIESHSRLGEDDPHNSQICAVPRVYDQLLHQGLAFQTYKMVSESQSDLVIAIFRFPHSR